MQIIVNELSYIYDEGTSYETHALAGVSLTVSQGEFIGLIGQTGSGKSTLIRMFNGLLKPTYGSVYIDGADIFDKDYDLKSLRGRIGMVFQYPEHQLFENSVIEDVKFGPKNQGIDDLQVEMRSFEALKAVGIGEELLDVSPLQLSGGQKRRVAIAGVLAMHPEVLILDEPTAGLDPGGTEEMYDMLHRLNEESGVTVILISHKMEDVAAHASRVIVMDDGRVVMDDTPEAVFTDVDALRAHNLRAPVAAEIMNELSKRGIRADYPAITLDQAANVIATALRR